MEFNGTKEETQMEAACPVFDSSLFTYAPDIRELVAEASYLGRAITGRVLAIRSARTGQILRYERSFTKRDREGEVVFEQYRPVNFFGQHALTHRAAEQYPTVTIIND